MSKIQHIESADFDSKVIKATEPVLVDFYATWCGPCKAQSPVLEELAQMFEGRVSIYKMDVEKNPDVVKTLVVRGVPTLVFFRGGDEVSRMVGYTSRETLAEQFNTLLTVE